MWSAPRFNTWSFSVLIYINDIASSSDLLHFILFADDTSVFMSHNNLRTLVDSFNSEINKLKTLSSQLSWGIRRRSGVYQITGVVNHPG